MLFKDTTIYPIIKEYPDLCRLYSFQRNEYITRPEWNVNSVWYLVNGLIKVETTTLKGKKILVDLIEEDNYIGYLSAFSDENFLYDNIVMEPSSLLRIPIDAFHTLMNTEDFRHHFYTKTHIRLYEMHKKEMMRVLFTQRQQFAFYIIEQTEKDICRIHSFYFIGEYLKISRRNLYNLLAQFSEEGILVRLEDGNIQVLNKEALQEIAQPICDFYYCDPVKENCSTLFK